MVIIKRCWKFQGLKKKLRYLVTQHRLEISQAGLESNEGLTWEMIKRRGGKEVHKYITFFFFYIYWILKIKIQSNTWKFYIFDCEYGLCKLSYC